MASFIGNSAANYIAGTALADTIYGGGGNDTLEGRGGNDLLHGDAGNDRIYGGGGDDVLYGGGGDDSIAGAQGNDRIVGGLGSDVLTGGAGSDTFVYRSLSELSTTYGAEWITDWDELDRIDLSAIDANALIAGNQAFEFAGYNFGSPPADTTPGTLTIGGFGGDLWIIGYTDGDAEADLLINLWSAGGEGALTVGDLIL